MKKRRMLATLLVVMTLAVALVALASCGQSQQSSSSSSSSSAKPEASEAKYTAPEEPFYALIVGDDTRKGTIDIDEEMYADGTGRSDTIMLARVDPKTYQVTLVTIPRDTEDSINGQPTKINERYRQGGIDGLLDAVEGLTGVRPEYYLTTTFVNFEGLVNKLEGIDMYIPVDQSMRDIVGGEEIEYSKGDQHLDGAQALVFARERKKYNSMSSVGGEPFRQTNDRLIVQTIMNKVLSDPKTAGSVSTALLTFCDTNWNAKEFQALAEDFAKNADKVTYLSGTGPYEGYTNDAAGWLAYRDEDTWHKIIDVVNSGGDPNTVVKALSLYE